MKVLALLSPVILNSSFFIVPDPATDYIVFWHPESTLSMLMFFAFLIYWRQTGMSESNLPVQCLVNQKRLSYSLPAIYGDQMGLVTLVKSMQLLDFILPSNRLL